MITITFEDIILTVFIECKNFKPFGIKFKIINNSGVYEISRNNFEFA